MNHLSDCLVFVAASLTVCCASGGAVSPVTGSHTHHSPHDKLSLCTDKASVPTAATSCLLDLGTGVDTYWMDTDGVAPGTAGCHDEYTDASCSAVKTGRAFGEFCLDDDRLVESNPGMGECHTHGNDLGHPDVVSCGTWCQQQESKGGRCKGDVAAEGTSGPCVSARCVCDDA